MKISFLLSLSGGVLLAGSLLGAPSAVAVPPGVEVAPARAVPVAAAVAVAPAAAPTALNESVAPYNRLILEQIRTMPQGGGYSAGHEASQRLGSAVQLAEPQGLRIAPEQAQPSYCSGATYLVFLKTVNALANQHRLSAAESEGALAPLLIAGQPDGQGVWGRWNANGPGTARLFYELKLGTNFSDYASAQPGDFMKVFWNDAVGRREHGHSVIYLGAGMQNGVDSVHFWSSNLHVGYSDKWVPRSRIKAVIFSRLMSPQNVANAGTLAAKPDPYLASLLTADSSMEEVRRRCGM